MAWNQPEPLDEIPLSLEERQRLIQQGLVGRAALVHRAAQRRMTPMELISTGEVTIHSPQRFEDDRTLPEADTTPQVEEETIEVFGGTLKITPEMLESFKAGKDENYGRWTRTTEALISAGAAINLEDAQPGDLVIPEQPVDVYYLDDEIIDAEIVDE